MPGAALNAFHTILLKQLSGNSSLSMTINNHPLPPAPGSQASYIIHASYCPLCDCNLLNCQQVQSVGDDPYGFTIGVLTVFGFSVLLATFILFVVKEKESGAKHLQFVSGMHSSTYLLANYLFDSLIILIVIVLSTVVVVLFQINAFSVGEPLAAIVLLMVSLMWLLANKYTILHPYRCLHVLLVYRSPMFVATFSEITS